MIEEFIGKTFATRNAAQVAHFRSTSYAQHMALGALYEEIPDLVDAVVEAYQGLVGLVDEVKVAHVKGDLLPHLKEEADWIEVNREMIAGGSNAVANLVDAVTAAYLKAIYKLENFA